MQNIPFCFQCKSFYGRGHCAAFPNGIPVEILLNEKPHNKVRDDQQGEWVYEENPNDDES